jgi:hypothetical protein
MKYYAVQSCFHNSVFLKGGDPYVPTPDEIASGTIPESIDILITGAESAEEVEQATIFNAAQAAKRVATYMDSKSSN